MDFQAGNKLTLLQLLDLVSVFKWLINVHGLFNAKAIIGKKCGKTV